MIVKYFTEYSFEQLVVKHGHGPEKNWLVPILVIMFHCVKSGEQTGLLKKKLGFIGLFMFNSDHAKFRPFPPKCHQKEQSAGKKFNI
jgi:hypothetical protein